MPSVYKKLESAFTWLASTVYRHKYASLASMLLITCLLAAQLPNLTIDTREESFFHEDDPTLIAYNEFRNRFGQDDLFFIALAPENGLTNEFLAILSQLHHDLAIRLPYLDEITSLVNGRVVQADGDTLRVEDLMAQPPTSDAERNALLATLDRYPIHENMLISRDRSLAIIVVRAKAIIESTPENLLEGFEETVETGPVEAPTYLSNAQNVEIDATIREVLKAYTGRGIEFYCAGTPVFIAEIQRGIEADLGRMIPLSFGVIILFLAILFRRVSGVIYPLITVIFSLVSSMGIMALWQLPITNAIQILPTFLIVVGIADSVHILTIFYRNLKRGLDKREAIVAAVAFAGLPVLMTSVTTACGLLSFIWADVAIIADLGYIAPVGVMLAFVYTVVMLPALIAIFPVQKQIVADKKSLSFSDTLFNRLAAVTTGNPWRIVIVSSLIVTIAAVAASTVRFSHNAMTWLPHDSTARRSTELLDEKTGGTVMLEVVIDAGQENGFHDLDLLARLDRAAREIPAINVHDIRAGKVISMADILKETHRALHEGRDAAYRIPQNRELIAQEMILFESAGSDDLEEVTDSTYRLGRLSILAPFTDSILYKDYIDTVRSYLTDQFDTETIILTGHMSLFVDITKRFITSMAKSYGFALVVVTFLMLVMVGRFGLGMTSMAANLVPIILVFGVMGAASIPLDMATILIGSLVLGLVVDDTIHFLHHFRREMDRGKEVEQAVAETLNTTGRALVVTSLVLSGGFFIYTASTLANNVRFGFLSGCAVLIALVADFVLLPALLQLIYGRQESEPASAN